VSCEGYAGGTMSRVGYNLEPYICNVYDSIFGDFPAKYAEYTPHVYGSGQPEL
jgi:hypothetical protein